MNEQSEQDDLFQYGDDRIVSADAPIPRWLKWSYIVLVIWGFIWLYLFWNGSWGWFDRGYWAELQKAANTTFPTINLQDLPPQK